MVQFSRFASLALCIQTRILHECSGFPHSDITVSLLFCQLLRAFRRLTRPSSPIIAKASTWCTYSLDSIIWSTFWLCYTCCWLQLQLRYSTLIKLTALLWIISAFCVSEIIDTIITQIYCLTVLPVKNCLCLLISAFQFVKDRCVVSQIKTILNFKIFKT